MKFRRKNKLMATVGLGLVFAGAGLAAVDFIRSSHSEQHDGTGGGFYIVQTAEVSHRSLIPAAAGVVLIVASVLPRRT